jgi:hypothetical protein
MSNNDAERDIRDTVQRLLDRPISDENKVLEIIVDAITSHYVDPKLVERAVRQSVYNYENQLRVFMVAAANTQLRRMLRLISYINECEEELFNRKDKATGEKRLAGMKDQDLIRAYASAQANFNHGMDYVQKVVDMRLELAKAQGSLADTVMNREREELNALSGLPTLNTQQRDRCRRIIEGMVDNIKDMNEGSPTVTEDFSEPPKGGNGVPE